MIKMWSVKLSSVSCDLVNETRVVEVAAASMQQALQKAKNVSQRLGKKRGWYYSYRHPISAELIATTSE